MCLTLKNVSLIKIKYKKPLKSISFITTIFLRTFLNCYLFSSHTNKSILLSIVSQNFTELTDTSCSRYPILCTHCHADIYIQLLDNRNMSTMWKGQEQTSQQRGGLRKPKHSKSVTSCQNGTRWCQNFQPIFLLEISSIVEVILHASQLEMCHGRNMAKEAVTYQ